MILKMIALPKTHDAGKTQELMQNHRQHMIKLASEQEKKNTKEKMKQYTA